MTMRSTIVRTNYNWTISATYQDYYDYAIVTATAKSFVIDDAIDDLNEVLDRHSIDQLDVFVDRAIITGYQSADRWRKITLVRGQPIDLRNDLVKTVVDDSVISQQGSYYSIPGNIDSTFTDDDVRQINHDSGWTYMIGQYNSARQLADFDRYAVATPPYDVDLYIQIAWPNGDWSNLGTAIYNSADHRLQFNNKRIDRSDVGQSPHSYGYVRWKVRE